MALENIDEQILDLILIEKQKRDLKLKLAELDEREEMLKEFVIQEMKLKELKTFENEEIKITYVASTSREGIDLAKLKKSYPAIANDCRKISDIKENLKLTLRGE